jgi:hypothetical protein
METVPAQKLMQFVCEALLVSARFPCRVGLIVKFDAPTAQGMPSIAIRILFLMTPYSADFSKLLRLTSDIS